MDYEKTIRLCAIKDVIYDCVHYFNDRRPSADITDIDVAVYMNMGATTADIRQALQEMVEDEIIRIDGNDRVTLIPEFFARTWAYLSMLSIWCAVP